MFGNPASYYPTNFNAASTTVGMPVTKLA